MSEIRECQYCHKTIEADALICPYCERAVALFDEKGRTRLCPDCGRQIPTDAAACMYCGRVVERVDSFRRVESFREYFAPGRLFSFSGQASRKEFISALLVQPLLGVLIFFVILLLSYDFFETDLFSVVLGFAIVVYLFACVMISLAVSIRRLRDIDNPNFPVYFLFIPMLNLFMFLVLLFMPGKPSE